MASPVFDLCDRYVTELAALDPVWATLRGVAGPVGAGTDYSPDGDAARAELMRRTLGSLAPLPRESAADEAAATFLAGRLRAELDWHDAGGSLRYLRVPFGLVATVRDSVDLLARGSADPEPVRNRLAAVPAMLAGWRQSLAVGLDRGLPAARRQAVEGAAQAERYATGGTHDELVRSTGGGELAAAAAAAHEAYAQTARWLREDYAPRAAEADAVGPERHALARRLVLGADLDPVESYGWAWAELHRIEAELAAEADRVRPGASVAEAAALLDETDVVVGPEAYQGWLQEQHDAAIARLDGVHFDIAPALRTVDATLAVGSSAGSPYYTPPAEDFSRPGRTWWPLGGRERFGVWAEQTTVFHEGVPGHHLQLGQARVLGDQLSRHQRIGGCPGTRRAGRCTRSGWPTSWGGSTPRAPARHAQGVRAAGGPGGHRHRAAPGPADPGRGGHGTRWTFEVATEVLRTGAGSRRTGCTRRWSATAAGRRRRAPTSWASGPGWPPGTRRRPGSGPTSTSRTGTPAPSPSAPSGSTPCRRPCGRPDRHA